LQAILKCCAGLDVHKKTLEATVRSIDDRGCLQECTRGFGTMTCELLQLYDWLRERGVTHVAMESTGVFWKPIYNILEAGFEVWLVNAQHVKQVPGRKTDVSDSQWLAKLLQHGLLRPSFVPPPLVRELRDLTRHRTQLVSERVRVVNRLHKTLEDANIKLGSVASDIVGVSGQAMIQRLIEVETDPAKLADLAQKRLRGKIPQLELALEGRLTEHHRFLLRVLWDQLEGLERLVARLDRKIEEKMAPFAEQIAQLDEIPGIDQRVAQTLLAEIGTDMSRFPSHRHLASWAGMSPGNNESAGKRKSGKTSKGSRWLRQGLVQAAWAVSHTKHTYLSAQFRRLAARRGRKRALVAVGHSILVVIYHMLRDKCHFRDLGEDFFDNIDPQRLSRYLANRLEALGNKVTLAPIDPAA